MGSGGKRLGAGRKPLAKRDTRQFIENASQAIDRCQPRAIRALEEALDAFKKEIKIIGKDPQGNPVHETMEFADHSIRIQAAKILLAKRIPDATLSEDKLLQLQQNNYFAFSDAQKEDQKRAYKKWVIGN